jgi:hypothetical protein
MSRWSPSSAVVPKITFETPVAPAEPGASSDVSTSPSTTLPKIIAEPAAIVTAAFGESSKISLY